MSAALVGVHMHSPQILEICVTNSEFIIMAYNILAHTLYCVGVVGIMLVTMSMYVQKTSHLPPHSMQNLLVQYT